MKNFDKQYTENKNAALLAAKNEKYILPEELLQEIEPLLKEYFIGNFLLTKTSLKMNFKNGQNFTLSIQEV